ncbi:MAG: signal peptidase I [Rhodothermales bacterium]
MDRLDPSSGAPLAGAYADPPLQEVATARWRERRSILWEWGGAVALALIAALLIRALFFEAFRIPSESMENTLQVGDFVLVSKLHYGPRLPITLGLPFTKLYLDDVHLPYLRFPGFTGVHRGDVIVFNVPTETEPLDRKTHYIKRVIGLPGDSLSIINKIPYAGQEALPMMDNMKQRWRAFPVQGETLPLERLTGAGVVQITLPQRRDDPVDFEATVNVARDVAQWAEVREVKALVRSASLQSRMFPSGHSFSPDNYGPLYIPAEGDTVAINDATWSNYEAIVTHYEGHEAERLGENQYTIDGKPADSYVIEQDYFFVMGDNRDSSLDSRTWGYVPKDHIVGKAVLIYFSWDPYQKKARAERIPLRIH